VDAGRRGGVELLQVHPEPHCWRRLDLLGAATGSSRTYTWSLVSVTTTCIPSSNGTAQRTQPGLAAKAAAIRGCLPCWRRASRARLFPRVVWLVPDERRATWLRQLIGRTGGLTGELHAIGRHDDALRLLTGGQQ